MTTKTKKITVKIQTQGRQFYAVVYEEGCLGPLWCSGCYLNKLDAQKAARDFLAV